MKTAYSYTVLRYVHDIASGEFVNVGVALYAPASRYVSALCRTSCGRLAKVFPGVDRDSFKGLMRYVQSRFEEMESQLRNELPLNGNPESVKELAMAVLPVDDSSLQWSPVGGGITEDPAQTLESLFERMVGRYDEHHENPRLSDDDVWRRYKRRLEPKHVLKHLKPVKIGVADDEFQFNYSWKNGVWNCLEPVSFDLSAEESIREKAHKWLGQISSIKDSRERFKLYMLVGEPQQEELRRSFDSALSILGKMPVENEIVLEARADEFSEKFAAEIAEHEQSH